MIYNIICQYNKYDDFIKILLKHLLILLFHFSAKQIRRTSKRQPCAYDTRLSISHMYFIVLTSNQENNSSTRPSITHWSAAPINSLAECIARMAIPASMVLMAIPADAIEPRVLPPR